MNDKSEVTGKTITYEMIKQLSVEHPDDPYIDDPSVGHLRLSWFIFDALHAHNDDVKQRARDVCAELYNRQRAPITRSDITEMLRGIITCFALELRTAADQSRAETEDDLDHALALTKREILEEIADRIDRVFDVDSAKQWAEDQRKAL